MPIFKGKEKQEEFLAKVRHEEEENRAKILAEKTGHTYLNLAFIPIETDALSLIPKERAEKAEAAIVGREVKVLSLAVINPDSDLTRSLISDLEKSGYALKIAIVSRVSLEKAFSSYPPARAVKEITGQVEISKEGLVRFQKEITDVKTFQSAAEKLFESRATEVVEAALAGALILRASDIHFEPEKEQVRLRLRLDGVLEDVTFLPVAIYNQILNRIKLLSGLKLNVHEKAQDGRFSILSGDTAIEIRTSILPGAYGENIVMRILDPNVVKIDLKSLGIREDDLEIIEKQIGAPTGMILTTGPTGSGKTTTLYAFIKKILTPEVKTITIEDPIEYHIEGISQTQVDPEKGYTFENGLRAIVRQDPDVILVGEIRDFETAEIAMHAALTGHLVFSTLHTNDAVGAIPRLIDLGVKPPVIAPAINLIMAQRLLRRVCSKCAAKRKITEEEFSVFKKILKNLPKRVNVGAELNEKSQIAEVKSCPECHDGYSGRVAVMELFEVNDEVEKLILEAPTEVKLKEEAFRGGMVTMTQDAVIKILRGMTTVEEAERILGSFE